MKLDVRLVECNQKIELKPGERHEKENNWTPFIMLSFNVEAEHFPNQVWYD